MTIALVVLNDIHFQHAASNLPVSQVSSLVAAIASENVTLDALVVLFAGDIANTGLWLDYQVALQFVEALKSALTERYGAIEIYWFGVPGNHDCILPEDGVDHRKTEVDAGVKTLLAEQPDKIFVEHLLNPQRDYWQFAADFDHSPTNDVGKLAGIRTLHFGSHTVQINLLNSAVLSQRREAPGSLFVPIKLYQRQIPPPEGATISITAIHHPMQWFETENMLALRHFLNRTSDIVITGHQHFKASFSQTHESGERVLYFESPALNDRSGERLSSFLVLTFDLNRGQYKACVFEWTDSLYRPKSQIHEWKPLELNRGVRPFFTLTEEFASTLSDPGVIYLHADRRKIALSDLFVYPDLKSTGSKGVGKGIRGPDLYNELSRSGVYVIRGDAFSGKTALARSLFLKFFVENDKIPVLIDATKMSALNTDVFEKRLIEELQDQYANADVDVYRQLPSNQRVVLVDNWHHAKLTVEAQSAIYRWLRFFASSSILFTDKLHEIKQIVNASETDSVIPQEESPVSQFEIIGLSHVGRGNLIHRWLSLRKDSLFDPPDSTKESKDTEDTVSKLLGKDRLPPYAFFVICLLQAKENRSIENIAGGSFGHLYEVLVVSALSQSGQDDPQIDRKYAFLSEIAAYMWRGGTDHVSLEAIKKIAASYTEQFAIELDVPSLVRSLEAGRVLSRTEDHYNFSYAHFLYYFVARYIRDRVDETEDTKLLESIDYMIDHISSGMNSTIIMFLIYFAKEKRRIINRIVDNANKIYAGTPAASFESDIAPFLNKTESPAAPEIVEDEDIVARRAQHRRQLDDGVTEPRLSNGADHDQIYAYTDDLPDAKKLHLADRSIDALGQIIRNFSATLPIATKKEVLGCAYRLGLRTMYRTMELVASVFAQTEELLAIEGLSERLKVEGVSLSDARRHLEMLKLISGKVVAIVLLKKVSSSVGVADMERAYEKAMHNVRASTATRLLEVTIEIEHFKNFPESKITRLSKEMRSNPFAQSVLHWIVASHLMLYRVDRRTRQKMAQLLNIQESKLLASPMDERNNASKN